MNYRNTYAELDSEVVVENLCTGKAVLVEDKATVYTQDQDGAYFVYNMAPVQKRLWKTGARTKIKVTGYKAEWSGVEITLMLPLKSWKVIPTSLPTRMLPQCSEPMNWSTTRISMLHSKAWLLKQPAGWKRKWRCPVQLGWLRYDGDDLILQRFPEWRDHSFVVESYLLSDNTNDVYAAVKNLQIGDVIDMEGFLYWYEGVNPHIIL